MILFVSWTWARALILFWFMNIGLGSDTVCFMSMGLSNYEWMSHLVEATYGVISTLINWMTVTPSGVGGVVVGSHIHHRAVALLCWLCAVISIDRELMWEGKLTSHLNLTYPYLLPWGRFRFRQFTFYINALVWKSVYSITVVRWCFSRDYFGGWDGPGFSISIITWILRGSNNNTIFKTQSLGFIFLLLTIDCHGNIKFQGIIFHFSFFP